MMVPEMSGTGMTSASVPLPGLVVGSFMSRAFA